MRTTNIKLFTNQPKLTKENILELSKRGLVVPEKTPRVRPNCEDEITNPTAGDVVSYRTLDSALRQGEVSQDDARRLLVIEATRANGRPRQTHISRLIIVAFSEEKKEALEKIEKIAKKQWQLKNK